MADIFGGRKEKNGRPGSNIIEGSGNGNTGEGGKKPSLLVFPAVAAVLALIIFGIYHAVTSSVKYEYTAVWQRDAENADGTIDTFRGYAPFAGGVIKYTKDGAEYIDQEGSVIWERSYEINAPIIDVSNKYAVIADQGSTSFYIFSTTELTGASETLLPVSLARISDNGVAYMVLNDSDADYITAFRSDGSSIDLSVKSVVSGDGYPFDIDVSPDGTQLITSYVGMENGQLANNVVFRNFGTVGQNEDSRRIVGGFKDEFEGHLVGRVHFSDDEYSQAFYDGGIVFFSTKVLNMPEVLMNVRPEEKMLAIDYNEIIVAVLTENDAEAENSEGESAPIRLVIYGNDGGRLCDVPVDLNYKGMAVSGSNVIIYNGQDMAVYSKKGRLKASLEYEGGGITGIVGSGKSNFFYVMTGNSISKINF